MGPRADCAGGQAIHNPCRYNLPSYEDIYRGPNHSAAGLTADGRLVLITSQHGIDTIARLLVEDFYVVTALKFDGGRSASMVWLDDQGQTQALHPSGVRRGVAQGLLMFSQVVDTSQEKFTCCASVCVPS